jgi:hypothetical protein
VPDKAHTCIKKGRCCAAMLPVLTPSPRTGRKALQTGQELLTIPDRKIAFWCMTVRGLKIDDMQNRQ